MEELIYLYGFVDNTGDGPSTTPRLALGVARDSAHRGGLHFSSEGLFTIAHADIACLAKHVLVEQFGDVELEAMLKDVEWLKSQLWEHERTLEEVMKTRTILPLKWGTLFRTEEAVQTMLKDQREVIRNLLVKLEGCQEWTVRIYVNRRQLQESVCALNQQVQQMRASIEKLTAGTAYLFQERLKMMSDEIGQRALDGVIQELYQEFVNHAEAQSRTEPVPGDTKKSEMELVFQMAFLVHSKKLQAFKKKVEIAAQKHHSQGFQIHLVGPFPPYYFCNLELNKQSANHG